ncbi:hypothetical protein Nepgr_018279 [Nepenthes gracilis]|uniref:Uncharacterized protein n=1 Tax=Nepenthes gracilis TaxID=150966 RepID=A0AAD3XTB0_NEPGR|nr:hypothetical protein Nepgr_018279 [Nepenthes gracilis]
MHTIGTPTFPKREVGGGEWENTMFVFAKGRAEERESSCEIVESYDVKPLSANAYSLPIGTLCIRLLSLSPPPTPPPTNRSILIGWCSKKLAWTGEQ